VRVLRPAPPRAWRLRQQVSPLRALALVACCAVALAGCEQGPAAPSRVGFDPSAVESALATLDSVLDTPTMQSLTALSPQLLVAATPPAPPVAPSVACSAPARAAGREHAAASPATSLIADSLFRHVLVYDTAARAYRVGPDSGGPAGGIRFVLYPVGSNGLPTMPLSSDGWLDLIDQSAGGVLQLHTQVSSGTTVMGDYLVGLSGTQAADTAYLAGTVTDGTHALAFRDSTARAPVAGTVAIQVAVSAHVVDSLGGFKLDMLAWRTTFDPFDYDDTLDITVTSPAQTIRLVGAISTYCLLPTIGLTVAVNGADYARITSGGAIAYVTLLGGQSAPSDESQALLAVKAGQRKLFLWLGALFAPAQALLP